MNYSDDKVIKAFGIYSELAKVGKILKDDARYYLIDDEIRSLVDQFASQMQCTVFVAGEFIYMIPIMISSEFHVSNDSIKKDYLPSKAVNADIYIMYVAIIILFGEFYDGYQTINPTRDFISIEEWLEAVNSRVGSLKDHGEENLKILEKDYEYNWIDIVNKWEPLDDLKENVKTQDARTKSRYSILEITKNFLIAQELIIDIGNSEIELSEKAKIIIQRYYMEYEYNRGILEFIYSVDNQRKEM